MTRFTRQLLRLSQWNELDKKGKVFKTGLAGQIGATENQLVVLSDGFHGWTTKSGTILLTGSVTGPILKTLLESGLYCPYQKKSG